MFSLCSHKRLRNAILVMFSFIFTLTLFLFAEILVTEVTEMVRPHMITIKVAEIYGMP